MAAMIAEASDTLKDWRRSLDQTEICQRIIPQEALIAIYFKSLQVHLLAQFAKSAHGKSAQELRTQLRLMCAAIDELNEMRSGVEEGLGR